MKKRSDKPEDFDALREKIIGLGERSVRKSYYPKLQQQLQDLERAEERFRQLSQRYETILQSAGEGIFGLDLQGNYTFMNRAAEAMLGYGSGDLIGKHSHSSIHYFRVDGSCYPEEECKTYAAFKDGRVRRVDDECFCRKDGTRFLVEYTSTPIRENGEIVGAVVTFNDITERKRTEEDLNMMKFSVDNASVSAFLVARDARILYVNEQAYRRLGYSREELLSMRISDLDPNFPLSVWDAHWNNLKKKGSLHFETLHVRKDGNMIPVQVSANYISFAGREYNWGFSIDISERKRAENELRRSYTLTKTIIDSMNDAVSLIDVRDSRIIGVNKVFLESFGFSDESEVIGKHCYEITHRKGFPCPPPDDVCPLKETVRTGEHFSVDHVHYGKEGEKLFVEVSSSPIKDDNGNVVRVVHVQRDITERKRTEEALRLSEARFRNLFQQSSLSMQILSPDGRTLEVNRAWEDLWGVKPGELKNYNILEDKQLVATGIMPYIRKGFTGEATEIPVIFYDPAESGFAGRARSVKAFIYPVKGHDGHIHQLVLLHVDVTEMVKAEKALRESEERLALAQRTGGVGVFDWDRITGKVIWTSQMEELFGLPAGGFEGTYEGWARRVHPDDLREMETEFRQWLREGRRQVQYEYRFVHADGQLRWMAASAQFDYRTDGTPVRMIGTNVDITARKRMEDEIRHMAHHDALTGLPNRRLFREIVELEIAQARRNKRKVAILFLDLDRFKEINDTLGHEAGDALLIEVAGRFTRTIRESDTVARIGGDEFNILMSDIHRTQDITDIVRKVIASLRKPIIVNGNELNVTTSIGISVYPDDGSEIDILLRYADIAMYHAKESGRNAYRFYNPSINVRSIERMRLEGMLRRSIEAGELKIYYQPQVDIQTNRMVCSEALVRWENPEKGLLTPDQFIPLAEETGFITEIDTWALRRVCSQVTSWMEAGLAPVCVTVNLSSRQFRSPDLVEKIASILSETGMPPELLDLEVTESTAMSDVEHSASQLRDLQQMGVHVSIDDFGTGYSSLNYLKKLPIERIKIDKSFVRDIATDADDRTIITAVTAMAHNMKLKVIAEGVETEEQLSFLRSTGCDEMQGFLFSRPLPADEFRELISRRA